MSVSEFTKLKFTCLSTDSKVTGLLGAAPDGSEVIETNTGYNFIKRVGNWDRALAST